MNRDKKKKTGSILPLIMVACMFLQFMAACHQPIAKDAPLEEKIRQVEEGLLPGYGFPPWNKKTIIQRMAHYGIPAVSIALIYDYKLEWAKAYGVMEAVGNRPVTTGTMFQALGVGNRLTHFLALHLVDKGLLRLDEDIHRKPIMGKTPENRSTMRQELKLEDLLNSNDADHHILLQQLLEDVSQEPFHETVRRLIFKPLQMTDSTFQQPLPPHYRSRAADGHEKNVIPLKSKRHVFPETAAKNLWTTPSDLARFTLEFIKVYNGESNRLVSWETLCKAVDPCCSYFNINDSGSGFYCSQVFNVKTGQGIILMMNSSHNSRSFKRELLHSVFTGYRWLWGDFIKRREIINSLILTLAAALILLIMPLALILFLLRRNKRPAA
jgi:hypothetical protein